MKITKRDITFFFLGIICLFIFEAIYDWEKTVDSFNRGWHDGAKKN